MGLVLFTLALGRLCPGPDAGAAHRRPGGAGPRRRPIVVPLEPDPAHPAFPAERRGAVVGLWGGIAGIAVAGGPLVGGAVTQGLDWHWIFWVNVPVGLVATAGAPGSRLTEARAESTSAGPARAGAGGGRSDRRLGSLIRAADAGWGSLADARRAGRRPSGDRWRWSGLGAPRAGADAAAAAVRQPRLRRRRRRRVADAAALMAAVFLTAQYFQIVLGYSPLAAGLRLLPWTATPLVVAPLAGALADRVGPRVVLATGLALHGGGLAWYGALATLRPTYASLVVPLMMAGVGASMALPTMAAAALGSVPPAQIGTASGVNTTMQRIGGAFGIALVGTVFAAHGHLGSAAAFVTGFRPAIAVAAGLSVLGVLAALAIPRRRASARLARPGPVAKRELDLSLRGR